MLEYTSRSAEGRVYSMQVQPGYSEQDVEELATHFPQKHIPDEFAWGKFARTIDKAVRHDSALVWAFEPVVQRSLWSRLWRRA